MNNTIIVKKACNSILQPHELSQNLNNLLGWRGDCSSVGKSSTSQSGDPGSNPNGGLTQITQCMNERGKILPAVKVILHQLA